MSARRAPPQFRSGQLTPQDVQNLNQAMMDLYRLVGGFSVAPGLALSEDSNGVRIALTGPTQINSFPAQITAYDFSQTPTLYAFEQVQSLAHGSWGVLPNGVTITITQPGQPQDNAAYEDNNDFAYIGAIVRISADANKCWRFSFTPPDLFIRMNNPIPVASTNIYDCTIYTPLVSGSTPGWTALGQCWAYFRMQIANIVNGNNVNEVPTLGNYYRASFAGGSQLVNQGWRPFFYADGPFVIGGGNCVPGGINLDPY